MAVALNVPKKGKSSKSHARSVTRFCEEANIAEGDQLDLAEFIVAARYLGTEANDEQLMNVFMDMEEDDKGGDNDEDSNKKKPKEVIKDLMKMVDDKYGTDLQGTDDNKMAGDDVNEILAINPLDAFSEDAIWQQTQIDDFLTSTQQDQNLKIARNLLATTALTRHEIAEITGVSADDLKDYESDEYETESDEEDEEEESAATTGGTGGDNNNNKSVTIKKPDGGVTIRATDFSKSVMLSKAELSLLKEIVDGGKDKVIEKSEDSLKLLTKLSGAINLSPGHIKRAKTIAKLNLAKSITGDADNDKKEKEVKLPQKYRVVIHPGALCKSSKELQSSEIAKLPIGTVCTVDEIDGRRARISSPHEGWCSLSASDGRMILQRSNVKSAAMDKAIHAERARQTKVLILKSITTLNDATVTRILEKSDWNLRRAIEAFYIAKYKTQEYLNKKDKSSKDKSSKNKSATVSSSTATSGAASTNDKEKKKQKLAWWKSWKTFANER
eukprot:467480_1